MTNRKTLRHPLLSLLSLCSITTLILFSSSCAWVRAQSPDAYNSALADPVRPVADVQRDALRKPAELLAFAGLKPGDKVADLMPGGGYFTRLFSAATGPKGHVYPVTPSDLTGLPPKLAEILSQNVGAMRNLATAYQNITPLAQPLGELKLPEPVDLVWTSQNYHDFYGYWGPAAAAAANAAIFKALKPGGIYLIIDHQGLTGSGIEATTSLHRIDPELVKAQVLTAGFVLESHSDLLHNPDDKHNLSVFDPALRGHTDQFVLKFRKP